MQNNYFSYFSLYLLVFLLAGHLNSTEPQYGDTLVLLAAYLLLDINKEKGNFTFSTEGGLLT